MDKKLMDFHETLRLHLSLNIQSIGVVQTFEPEQAGNVENSIPELISSKKIHACSKCEKLFVSDKRLQKHLTKNKRNLRHVKLNLPESQINSL